MKLCLRRAIYKYNLNSSFDFFPYSTDRRSIKSEENPEPVPPPKLWKTRNPCSPMHGSVWNKECHVQPNIVKFNSNVLGTVFLNKYLDYRWTFSLMSDWMSMLKNEWILSSKKILQNFFVRMRENLLLHLNHLRILIIDGFLKENRPFENWERNKNSK